LAQPALSRESAPGITPERDRLEIHIALLCAVNVGGTGKLSMGQPDRRLPDFQPIP